MIVIQGFAPIMRLGPPTSKESKLPANVRQIATQMGKKEDDPPSAEPPFIFIDPKLDVKAPQVPTPPVVSTQPVVGPPELPLEPVKTEPDEEEFIPLPGEGAPPPYEEEPVKGVSTKLIVGGVVAAGLAFWLLRRKGRGLGGLGIYPSSPKGTKPLDPATEENVWNAGYEAASWYASDPRKRRTKIGGDDLFILAIHTLRDRRIPRDISEDHPQFWEYVGTFIDGAKAYAASGSSRRKITIGGLGWLGPPMRGRGLMGVGGPGFRLPTKGKSVSFESHGVTFTVKRLSQSTWVLKASNRKRIRFGNAAEIREDIAHAKAYGTLPQAKTGWA